MARETQGSPADEKKLEQYGVWVKVKPRDVAAPALDESFELSDLESPGLSTAARRGTAPGADAEADSTLTEEEEQLLDELETELEPDAVGPSPAARGSSAAVSVPEEEPILADAELPEIEEPTRSGSSDLELVDVSEEELPELEEEVVSTASRRAGPVEVEVTLSEEADAEESFDDLAALETELASVTTKTRQAVGSPAAASSRASSEILARIEEELKSIRTDLNQLRSDLSGLRQSAAESDGKGQGSETGIKGGFLDEDEDETIALTGDELDNILNTAEITEESAEAAAVPMEMDLAEEAPAAEATGDILDYETPAPEPVDAPILDAEPAPEPDLSGDTLVLSDDDLLPTDGTEPASSDVEELPSDLVLEEVVLDEDRPPSTPESLPEIDLEGIPEIESAPARARAQSPLDDESETIDLETLDLGEEPTVINAEPVQVEEITELGAGEVTDLAAEDIPELGGEDLLTPASAGAETIDELPEVDLEALAAEAEGLEKGGPSAPLVEDLEIGELEAVPDEGSVDTPQKEIEIDLEGDLGAGPSASPDTDLAEEILDAEEIEEAEEAAPSGIAAGPSGAPGIPDSLKDEIRTVLKYMDHLLEALPDEKIQEFASSDYFVMYKKLFEDLGLGE